MIPRQLEPEVMDSIAEAVDYNAMDHTEVNRRFVADLLAVGPDLSRVLDVGTGTAQVPIELCRTASGARVIAIDAARSMLELAAKNIAAAGLDHCIELALVDAKRMPYVDGSFSTVMSNSIVHHIPDPIAVLRESVRVCRVGGSLFFRDLLRPEGESQVAELVARYAADANAHAQQMFADSLHAALTLNELRDLVESLGFPGNGVRQTSDRHWTWHAVKA